METDVLLAPYGADENGQPFPPHPTQEKIRAWVEFECCRPRESREGIPVLYVQHGVNAGGTRGILAPAIELMLQLPNMITLCGRKDFSDLRLSAMQTFLDIITPDLIASKDTQEHRYDIRVPDGVSIVYFKNLKDVKGLGSQEFGLILVHEAHEIEESMFRTLKHRCRQRGYPCIILMEGNPPAEGHWLSEMTNPRSLKYDSDITVFKLPTSENKEHMDVGYWKSLEAMPASWKRRYMLGEIGMLPSGTPVYPAFAEAVHVQATHIIPDRPLLRFLDFGLRRAACLWAQKEDSGRLLVHKEWMAIETPEEQFIDGVIVRTNERFGERVCIDYGDPAAKNRDPHGVSTLTRLKNRNINLIWRRTTYGQRIPLINRKLSEMIHGIPAILIDPSCSILIEGLAGGYHYAELKEQQAFSPNKDMPYRDGWFEHCVSGETRLRTLHGYKTIKSLVGKPCWVWSYSSAEKRMVPARLGKVWRTGEKEVLKLTHDGGELIATPEHEICLRDGSFVRMDHLKPGDELMPFYEQNKSRGKSRKRGDYWYKWIWLNDGSEGWEHRIVHARMNGHLRHKFNVDHIDGNVENNEPENLQLLSSAEHAIKTRSWTRNAQSITKRCCVVCGDAFESWFAEICSIRCRARKRFQIPQARWRSQEPTPRNCLVCGVVFESRGATICGSRCYGRRAQKIPKDNWRIPVNHRVVSIEPYGISEVYDFSIASGPHNAVADGIVIHNCVNSFEYGMVNLYGLALTTPLKIRIVQQRRKLKQWERKQGTVMF